MPSEDVIKQIRDNLKSAASKGTPHLYQAVVNTPFMDEVVAAQFFLGFIDFFIINNKTNTLERAAISNTELAKHVYQISLKHFRALKIPLERKGNLIIESILEGKPKVSSDWRYLFHPIISSEEAGIYQAEGGISYCAIYPVNGKKFKGALIFNFYQYAEQISALQRKFMRQYAATVASYI